MAEKRALIAGSVALVVPLLLCGGLAIGGGLLARDALTTHPCQPPAHEEALIAAYAAEPLLTMGASPPSDDPPEVYRFCHRQQGAERAYTHGYTEVTYRYPASGWRTAPELRAAYGPTAEAEGWQDAGGRNDTVAAIEFCRTLGGVRSTLTIAFVGDGNPAQHVTEVRQVVSVPADQSCPFQSDVWGPGYRGP